jgi:hypothetical protein
MPTLRTYRTDAELLDAQLAHHARYGLPVRDLDLLDGSAKSCDRFVAAVLAEGSHEQVRRAYVAAELAAFSA